MTSDLMSKKEAAAYLKVSEPTIDRWSKKGLLPSYKLHGCVRYRQPELDEFIHRCLKASETAAVQA